MRERNQNRSSRRGEQRNGNLSNYRGGRNERNNQHAKGKNGGGYGGVPPVILAVPGTDLEFGVWPGSGCWGPALITPDEKVRRSYDPEHLLDYPELVRTGIRFYLDEADRYRIDIDDRLRSDLESMAVKLEERFDLAA